MFWKIECQIERSDEVSLGVPTFYLHGAVQGIVDADHAARVGASVVAQAATEQCTLHVHAANLQTGEWTALSLPVDEVHETVEEIVGEWRERRAGGK